MFTMRSADEVRAAEFGAKAKAEAEADMVAVAETIMERRKAKFDPAAFRDRYQDAPRQLVDGKLKGRPARHLIRQIRLSLAANGRSLLFSQYAHR